MKKFYVLSKTGIVVRTVNAENLSEAWTVLENQMSSTHDLIEEKYQYTMMEFLTEQRMEG